jgi:hypothetical protein
MDRVLCAAADMMNADQAAESNCNLSESSETMVLGPLLRHESERFLSCCQVCPMLLHSRGVQSEGGWNRLSRCPDTVYLAFVEVSLISDRPEYLRRISTLTSHVEAAKLHAISLGWRGSFRHKLAAAEMLHGSSCKHVLTQRRCWASSDKDEG